MSQERELLDLIASSPDEDAHRLVYADLLSERGDPRGEFIALQIKRARSGLTEEEARFEEKLLYLHGDDWLGELIECVAPGSAVFERGFLTACTVDEMTAEDLDRLAASPTWRTVERLAGHVRIAAHGPFPRLRTIGPCALAELRTLWRSPAIPSITELIVRLDDYEPDQLRMLGDARPFPRLKRLRLIAPEIFDLESEIDLISEHHMRFFLAGRRARRLEVLAIEARRTLPIDQLIPREARPNLKPWWEQCRNRSELRELTLEPAHGIRYRFFQEAEGWSLEIEWRSGFATADLQQIQSSLQWVPENAFHQVVLRQIGIELPHHRAQLNRVLGRFPRLVIASAA